MRQRSALLLLIALAALIAILWASISVRGARASPSPTHGQPAEKNKGEANLEGIVSVGRADRVPLPAPEQRTEDQPPSKPANAHVAPVPEAPNLTARAWLEIRVVDEHEHPVPDAELALIGMRSESNPGAWYPYRGDAPKAVTDAQGRARLSYWVWVDMDGRTRSVDLTVTHPDFPSYRDDSFKLDPGEHLIILKHGTMVVVSGRIAAQGALVRDIDVEVDREARLPKDAWIREPDGRLSTSRLLPGKHLIWLEHESPEHGPCYSEITEFDLREGETRELDLELFVAVTLEGEFDSTAPRPIVDGHVLLSIQHGGLGADDPRLRRKFEAGVRDDGTFTIERLPRGHGQIIALCKGWVSKRTLADSALDAGIQFFGKQHTPEEEADALRRMGDRAFEAQRVQIPQPARPFVVQMEQTATLEVTVTTDLGVPLEGAVAEAFPNVHFIGMGNGLFPWRTWTATTDAAGRARIEDLPPSPDLWVSAKHDSFQLQRGYRNRPMGVPARSGEVSSASIKMELIPR
jgi:hypothetical protein